MVFLASSPPTAFDFGTVGLLFLVVMALIKIIGFLIKKPNNQDCSAEVVKKLESIEEKIKELTTAINSAEKFIEKIESIHIGNRAIRNNGEPRWYVPDDMIKKIEDVHSLLFGLVSSMKTFADSNYDETKIYEKSYINSYRMFCKIADNIYKGIKKEEYKTDIRNQEGRSSETRQIDGKAIMEHIKQKKDSGGVI